MLYVDDILIARQSMQEIAKMNNMLSGALEMKDIGSAKKILDQKKRKDRLLILSQQAYLKKVLENFGMRDSKPVPTPLAQHFKLLSDQMPKTEEEEEEAYIRKIPYASVLGSIMYAMFCSRPDLSYAVSMLSRFMSNPGKKHWFALKRVLRYVKGTVDKGLVYGGASSGCDEASVIKGFVDSDYAGCLDTRKSLTGFIFTAYWTTISWKAGLQKVMALSTMEAEYMALTEAVKEALWLLGLVFELNDAKQRFIRVFCDNRSALQLTKNQVFHERIKHIDVKLHFIRDS